MLRFLFGLLFSLFWASAFITGKYAVLRLPPLDGLSLRFLLAAVVIALLCLLWQRTAPAVWRNPALWRHGWVLGLLNYVLYLGLSYTGLQTVSPGLVVLIVSTMPFVTTLAVSLISGRWVWLQWLAVALGFAGVYVVLAVRMPQAAWSAGIVWTILGMLALAGGTLFYQLRAYAHPALPLTGVQNLFGGLLLLPLSTPPHGLRPWASRYLQQRCGIRCLWCRCWPC